MGTSLDGVCGTRGTSERRFLSHRECKITSTMKKLRSTPGFKRVQAGNLERCEGKSLFLVSMALYIARICPSVCYCCQKP